MIPETTRNTAPDTVRSYALFLYHMIQEQLEFSLGFEGLFAGSQETTDPEILDSARAAIIYTLYEKVGIHIGIKIIASELKMPTKVVSEIISTHELRISSLAKKYRAFRNILRNAPTPAIEPIVPKEKKPTILQIQNIVSITKKQPRIVRTVVKPKVDTYTYDLFCDELFEEIEHQTGFSKEEIITKNKKQVILNCRYIFCVISRICFPEIPLRIIGEKIGGKDHTTILHAFATHIEYVQSKDCHPATIDYRNTYNAVSEVFFQKFPVNKQKNIKSLLFRYKFKKNLSKKEFEKTTELFLSTLSRITNTAIDTIKSKSRETTHVTIRQVYIYLIRTYYPGISEKQIATALGYQDHSIISHHINQITEFIKQTDSTDKKVLQFIDIRDRIVAIVNLP